MNSRFFLLKPKKPPPWRPHGTCQAHADLLESSVVALREARDRRFCYVCHISYICFILYTVLYMMLFMCCVMMLILIDYVYVHSWLICSIMNMLICLITLVQGVMQPNINSNTQKERKSFATVLVGFHLPYVFGVSYYMHACMHTYIQGI